MIHLEDAKPRRLKLVEIPSSLLTALLRLDGSELITLHGLPADAEMVGINYQMEYDRVQMVFRSEEFPLVAPGSALQRLDIECREKKLRTGMVLEN